MGSTPKRQGRNKKSKTLKEKKKKIKSQTKSNLQKKNQKRFKDEKRDVINFGS